VAKLTKKGETQIREHLASMTHEQLIDEVMDRAAGDAAYARSMTIRAGQASGNIDPAIYRRAIADALRSGSAARRDRPRTSGRWANDVLDAISPVVALLDDGHGDVVIGICEYALGRVEKLMGRVDDSSGWFAEIVAQLELTHLRACRTASPDPVKLARRVFVWDAESGWDIFAGYAEKYQDVLGPDGLAEVQRLATEFWDGLPAPTGRGFDRAPGAFRVSRTLRDLAEVAGDVDAKVQVMSRDLSHPYHFLQIADVLAEAGREDDALAWAERGLDVDHEIDHMRHDTRVDDFVLERYVADDRGDEAMSLLWRRFAEAPVVDQYARLKQWAERLGEWEQHHDDALHTVRSHADARAKEPAPNAHMRNIGARPATHDPVVQVLVIDGDLDQAWDVAREHGCSEWAWRTLADASRTDRPLDAAKVYEREIDELVGQKTTRTYEDAVTRVDDLRNLYLLADRQDLFDEFADGLRREHAAKRKFIGLLDAGGIARSPSE
jgi:hypothetical protein